MSLPSQGNERGVRLSLNHLLVVDSLVSWLSCMRDAGASSPHQDDTKNLAPAAG